MDNIGFDFDVLADGIDRCAGGAQRRFAVLDIQTVLTGGFIWPAFGYGMDEAKWQVATDGLAERPFGRVDRGARAVNADNDRLWCLRIVHFVLQVGAGPTVRPEPNRRRYSASPG